MTRNLVRITKPWMFMEMAGIAALRSTCQRHTVGAVITDFNGMSVVSIGYNGNARGLPNACDSWTPGECGCIHAEINALLKAPFHQGPLIMYTTTAPCVDCAKLIINSKVMRVFYKEPYRVNAGLELLFKVGIQYEQLLEVDGKEQLELGP